MPGGLRFPSIVPQGALITSLVPGSPADRAGLPIGGIIVAFDGQRIESPEDLASLVRAASPGQKVELQYVQANRLFRKTVQLAPSPPVAEGTPLRYSPSPSFNFLSTRTAHDHSARRSDARPVPTLHRPVRRLSGRRRPPRTSFASVAELRSQVEALQRQVLELRNKVAELEKRLAAITPE